MRNLPLPSRDAALDDLKKALRTYRYRGKELGYAATEKDLEDIIALYDHYDGTGAEPCDALKGDTFSKELIEALYNAYDLTQENRKLDSIRELIFSDVELCPICGIDPAVELDHHLPRSVFKPLSIYTRNLVPLCHACNHTKSAGFGDQDEEERRFLHAYFDALPDLNFLVADIVIRDGGLVVEFKVSETIALPGKYGKRLTHQMTALNLNDRYKSEINTYISGHAVALHLHFGSGGAKSVRKFLKLQARYEVGEFYRNHWRPTLLNALAAHDEFTDGGFADVLPMPQDILDDIMDPN